MKNASDATISLRQEPAALRRPRTVSEQTIRCPGCGLLTPALGLPIDDRANASGECHRLFDEVSHYTLAHGRERFIHQHLVDAYGAQHLKPGYRSPIAGAFTLGGLYLALERGFSGRQVQDWHVRAARRQKEWPRFEVPAERGRLTIADVHTAAPGPERDRVLMVWCSSVWEAFAAEHSRVRELVDRWL